MNINIFERKNLYSSCQGGISSILAIQCDGTPVEVIHVGRPAGAKIYMWVHRSGEMYRKQPIVLYEYQKTRNSMQSKEFYKDYKEILVTGWAGTVS